MKELLLLLMFTESLAFFNSLKAKPYLMKNLPFGSLFSEIVSKSTDRLNDDDERKLAELLKPDVLAVTWLCEIDQFET